MQKFDYTPDVLKKLTKSHYDEGLRKYFLAVYSLMSAGLLITAIAALLVFTIPELTALIFYITPYNEIIGMTGLGWLITFAPLGISLYFTFAFSQMTSQTARILFWVYSALLGISLSSLGFVYTSSSIATTFFVCSIMFGAMSLYGYSTKKDLTSMGTFLFMGILGLLIASLINVFLRNSALEFALSFIGVFVFTGLIAFDTQRLKILYYQGFTQNKKIGILAAFTLYLDFINLFIYLIKFLGKKRDE